MKKTSQKLIAVQNVKAKLDTVAVSAVAKQLKCTRQNIYYHLNEDKAEDVSIPHLTAISAAIDKVAAAKKKAEEKSLSIIIN